MKVGVCEVHPEMDPGSREWSTLAATVRENAPDLFLLNEMPFGPWVSSGNSPDPRQIKASQELHEKGLELLPELGASMVLGTRAVEQNGRNVNEAFLWTPEGGLVGVHTKQYFPDEEGYFEARWFQPGDRNFRVVQAGELRVGCLICTELMFNEHARRYGREGAHVIAVPRAVGKSSLPRWLVAMRMAAIVSGCYVLSSNRSGVDSRGQLFGGCGWVIDPLGDPVAQTSAENPVVFYHLRMDLVATAQREYPCYVPELTQGQETKE